MQADNISFLLKQSHVDDLRSRDTNRVNFPGAQQFYDAFENEIGKFCDALNSLIQIDPEVKLEQVDQAIKESGATSADFRSAILQALEKISLEINLKEENLICGVLSIAKEYKDTEGSSKSPHWAKEHRVEGAHDLKPEVLAEIRSRFYEASGQKLHEADSIPNPYIEYTSRGKTRFLELADAGSIGLVFKIYNEAKYPVKAVKLISNLEDEKAIEMETFFNNFKEASEANSNCNESLITVARPIRKEHNQDAFLLEPMKALGTKTQTLENMVLQLAPLQTDQGALEEGKLKTILSIFEKLARSVQSSHEASYAHVNLKLDSYRTDPSNPDSPVSKVNQAMFCRSDYNLNQEPLFGSYALRDFSHDALKKRPKEEVVLWTDISSLGLYLAQTILGKKADGKKLAPIFDGAQIDPSIDTEWLTTLMYDKALRNQAHPKDTGQHDHMKTRYSWDGDYNGGDNLRQRLEARLANLPETQRVQLLNLLEDIIIYKPDNDQGRRNMRFRLDMSQDYQGYDSTEMPSIDRVVEILEASKNTLSA